MSSTFKKEKIDDIIILKLWYQGADDLYRRNMGAPSRSGGTLGIRLHNNPKERLFSYKIACVGFFSVSIILMYFTYFFMTNFESIDYNTKLLVSGITGILSLMLLCASIRFFISAKNLNNAIKSNSNTDLIDPLRMRTLRKAICRLIKTGKIIKKDNNFKINKTWTKVINSHTLQFTIKEKIINSIFLIGFICAGSYSLIKGTDVGITPNSYYFKGIFVRIIGLVIAISGLYLLKRTIESPTIKSKDN